MTHKLTTQVTTSAAYLGIVISLIVMGIWIVEPTLFVTLIPESATMKFNTALSFFLAFVYLIVSHKQSTSKWWHKLLLGVIFFISITTLLAYQLSIPFILDELIVRDPLTPSDAFPGRMSAATAFMFMLSALALWSVQNYPRIAEGLAVAVNLLSLLELFAFLFDFHSLYATFFFNTVAFHTALLFIVVSICSIFSIRDGLIRNLFILDEPAGIAMRFLLPMALGIPLVLSWVILQGVLNGWYQPTFAIALAMILTVFLQLLMVIGYSVTVRQWNRREKTIQHQLLETTIERIKLENAQQINRVKEEFFLMVSHDMRTPISVIVSSSDIMLQYQDRLDEDKRKRHLRTIRHQAFNMLEFVDDIILISQSDIGKVPYVPTIEDLASYCRKYHQEFVEINPLPKHQFNIDIPDIALPIEFDKSLLKRLISNLVSNAIKYSPDGGEIGLQLSQEHNEAHLKVSDQGIGIPSDAIHTLFDMFTRVENDQEIRGHGLGLAIVKQIADIHGAKISVDSVINQGTTFTVAFPLHA